MGTASRQAPHVAPCVRAFMHLLGFWLGRQGSRTHAGRVAAGSHCANHHGGENEMYECGIFEGFHFLFTYPWNLVRLLRLQKSRQRSENLANFLQLSDSTGDSQLEAI